MTDARQANTDFFASKAGRIVRDVRLQSLTVLAHTAIVRQSGPKST